MPENSRFLVPVSLACVFVIASCGKEPAAAPQMQMPPPEVSVVTLREQPVVLTRQLPGRTSAFVVAEVRPQVTGIVKERLFEEGSLVEAGQALYQLDDAKYRAAYNSALASLERAQATVEFARVNAKRAEDLVGDNLVSKQDYERARAEWQQAEADLGVAKALVASTKVDLDYARITSPIDGRTGKSSVTRGALVTADQDDPLTTVQQLDPIYVDISQSSSEILALRRELASQQLQAADTLPVEILLEDDTPYPHEGKLAFADATVNPATGSVSMRVIVPNPDHVLLPGMYVRAGLKTAVLNDAILVPMQGIARTANGAATALVVNGENVVESRNLAVSRTVGETWLVTDGLLPGDRVIVEGVQKVRPGMPVNASESLLSKESPDSGHVPEESRSAENLATGGAGN
jgi:membrane fusion protein (multidrug efflux system)